MTSHEFRRLENLHIVGLHPGDLGELVFCFRDPEALKEEQGAEPLVAVCRFNAKYRKSVGLYLLNLETQGHLQEAEDTLPATGCMENLVDIWQGEREADFAAVDADKDDDARVGDRLEIIGRMKKIFEGDRIESPVAVKALIVESMDRLQLLVEVLHVDRAERHRIPFFQPVDDLYNSGRLLLVQRNIPCIERPDISQTDRLVHRVIEGRIPRHRNEGRPVVALRQYAAIIVD